MRDKNRIPKVLHSLQEFWELNPDLRFFQLLTIILDKINIDSFYVEEDELLRLINEEIAREKGEKH